jgi:hypothetical protein
VAQASFASVLECITGSAGAMTNIVTFTPARASARRGRPRPEGPAAIVIFPGVRYERSAPPPRGSPRGGRAAGRAGKAGQD